MAMTAAMAQVAKPAIVVFTHRGTFTQDVKRVGDECWVPAFLPEKWGWTVSASEGDADILAEGRRVRVEAKTIDNALRVPLKECLSQLGGHAEWTGNGSTLVVTGLLRRLEFSPNGVELDSTLSVAPKTQALTNPDRYIIDLVGATLPGSLSTQPPAGVRIAQYQPNVVRIVVQRAKAGEFRVSVKEPNRSLRIPIPQEPSASESTTIMPSMPPRPNRPVYTVEGPPDPGGIGGTAETHEPDAPPVPATTGVGSTVGQPTLANVSERGLELRFPLSSSSHVSPSGHYASPTELELTLPGVAVGPEPLALPQHEMLKSIGATQIGQQVQLKLTLSQPASFIVSQIGREIRLRIIRPAAADGKLLGKTIVVDAGHGGPDSGASAGGVYEKDLTLQIAKQLSELLAEEGVVVIMTRNDDTRIPLKERAAIANRSGADLFVSVHINSNKVSNSRSGTTVYFHNQDPISSLLAECLRREICRVSCLPDLGTSSDTRIYTTGFAVLRYSNMPAVLLELGFINHARDRGTIVNKEFHIHVAQAVVKGLKVYVGDGKTTRTAP
jgi:N-acetylmuramoyl-L-alanine amidase